MPDYTEADIHTLEGPELDVAIEWVLFGRRTFPPCPPGYVETANFKLRPREMPLEWCVMELMGPGKVLEEVSLNYINEWSLDDCYTLDLVACHPSDPATAIKRAACIVASERGE